LVIDIFSLDSVASAHASLYFGCANKRMASVSNLREVFQECDDWPNPKRGSIRKGTGLPYLFVDRVGEFCDAREPG